VADTEQIVERLRSIEEELRDLAYDRLRAAAGAGDADALADEKKVLQARRAIERAINALGGLSETD
jgi:regulator of protease activity HflC (stomatin/prohibitin superfamily)